MRFDKFSFASIQIDGSTYEHDVMVDRGKIRQRKKKPSKQLREQYGHTPWSVEDKIPWKCQRLVVGHRRVRTASSDGTSQTGGQRPQD